MLLIMARKPPITPRLIKNKKVAQRIQKRGVMTVRIINSAEIAKLIGLWFPVAGCMTVIFYASTLPGSDIPSLFPFQDIAFHLFIYALLAFSLARALRNKYINISAAKLVFLVLVFGIIYGASDEFHQMFVPKRSASFFDLLIDGIGSLTGGLLYKWLR
jgi:hypothetical protein